MDVFCVKGFILRFDPAGTIALTGGFWRDRHALYFHRVAGVFVDSGFSSALIQCQDTTVTDESTVFSSIWAWRYGGSRPMRVGSVDCGVFRVAHPARSHLYNGAKSVNWCLWLDS